MLHQCIAQLYAQLGVARLERNTFIQRIQGGVEVAGVDAGVGVVDEEWHVPVIRLNGFAMPVERRVEIADEPEDATDEVARGGVAPVRQRGIFQAGVGAPQPAFRGVEPGEVGPCRGVAIVEFDRAFQGPQCGRAVSAAYGNARSQEMGTRHVRCRRQDRAAVFAGGVQIALRKRIKAGLKPALKLCARRGHGGISRSNSRNAGQRCADDSGPRTSPA